jgi:hypothetical protein
LNTSSSSTDTATKTTPSGHGRRLWASVLVACDYARGTCPVVVVRRSTLRKRDRNAVEIGRDFERGQRAKELSAVGTMLSAIQESLTTPRR